MKLTTNYRQSEVFQIIHQNKIVMGVNNIKFLGLKLDKHVSWKNRIQKLLSKLSSACYLARRLYAFCSLNTIKMIYFAYFHAIIEYGIIFWGNSVESKRIFQKKKKKKNQNHDRNYSKDFMQTAVSRITDINFSFSIHILPDEIPLIKLGNL